MALMPRRLPQYWNDRFQMLISSAAPFSVVKVWKDSLMKMKMKVKVMVMEKEVMEKRMKKGIQKWIEEKKKKKKMSLGLKQREKERHRAIREEEREPKLVLEACLQHVSAAVRRSDFEHENPLHSTPCAQEAEVLT